MAILTVMCFVSPLLARGRPKPGAGVALGGPLMAPEKTALTASNINPFSAKQPGVYRPRARA